jgi:parallel beta-helix repeat protein
LPEGLYQYSNCPNLAFSNLELVGDGHVELHYTGDGDALTFDGDSTAGGKFNMFVEGLRIVPTPSAKNGLVIKAIHHSLFHKVRVYGAGAPVAGGIPNHAIGMYWCVATELNNFSVCQFDSVFGLGGAGSYDCIGLWLDKVTQPADWQTTDCRFLNPIIENCRIGIYLNDAGGCMFSGGTVESCTDTGINMSTGGQNRSWGTWVEGNKNYDVVFGSGAKDNRFDLSHPSALKVKGQSFTNIVSSTVGLFGAKA